MGTWDPIEQGRRVEYLQNTKRALKQGATVEQRNEARDQQTQEWLDWFERRVNERGGQALQYIPAAMAELECRIKDEVAAEMRDLKRSLVSALTALTKVLRL
jgi:hypothetical protein